MNSNGGSFQPEEELTKLLDFRARDRERERKRQREREREREKARERERQISVVNNRLGSGLWALYSAFHNNSYSH